MCTSKNMLPSLLIVPPLQKKIRAAAQGNRKMEALSDGGKPPSWEELYGINLMPSEIFLKFRKETQGFRLGANLELYNTNVNSCHAKLVLKPLANEQRWKLIYYSWLHDVQLVSKKIPVTKFLDLQVGVAHSFKLHATGWKWKITTCLGRKDASKVQNKMSLSLCRGLDFRFGWRTGYVLPDITGGAGTAQLLFKRNSGCIQASLDRIEAIFTNADGT